MCDSEEPENYICDLGDRLEINKRDEVKVKNIWIQPIEQKESKPRMYVFEIVFKNGNTISEVTTAVEKTETAYLYLLAQKAAQKIKDANKDKDLGEIVDYRYLGVLDAIRVINY